MAGEVAVVNNGMAMALPSDVMARLAEKAKDASAKERPAISRISLKSGVMSYAGNAIPNNKMEAVILSAAFRNVWYAGRYDPNNIVNPNCFAIALDDDNMVPHPNVTQPVHPTCAGCPKNEWASDPNGGRGKACKQTRRLVLMPGSAVEKTTDEVLAAELAVMDIPVTSVKNFSTFVNTLTATAGVPPYAAVAEVSTVPDAKTQFKVNFRGMRVVPSVEILNAIEKRLEQADKLSIEPYEETANDDPPPAEEAVAAAAKKSKKF
jgi:hypothetical protein